MARDKSTQAQEATTNQETALVKLSSSYPALTGGGDVAEAMKVNMGDEEVTMFDLERIRVPSGGSLFWEVMGAEGTAEAVKDVSGIIVFTKIGRSYWKSSFEESGGGTPPDCSSADGRIGVGDPGGLCHECPLAEFGSAEGESRAQACKQQRFVFLLREGTMLPAVLALPPTSLKLMKQWLLQISQRAKPYWSFIVKFSLKEAKSSGGIKYAQVVTSIVRPLSEEEVGLVVKFAATTRDTFASYREGADERTPDKVDPSGLEGDDSDKEPEEIETREPGQDD